MRIAVLIESKIPSRSAMSIHMMKMGEALSELGHKVKLYCRSGTLDVEDDFQFYGVDRRKFDIEKFDLTQTGILGTFPYYWKVVPSIKNKFKPDLLYGIHAKSFLSYLGYSVPMLYEVHEMPDSFKDYFFESLLFLHPAFSGLISISQALKEDYVESFSLEDENVAVIPPGERVDNGGISSSPEVPGEDKALDVGYVGTLSAHKGIELILQLAVRKTEFNFHIVGGNESKIDYWKSRTSRVNENLFFHGFVPPEETKAYRESFDVLLAPYQLKKIDENRSIVTVDEDEKLMKYRAPQKIFEYMSSGTPIIVSNFSVLQEILEHRKTAWFCEPDEVEEWESALERLASNENLRQRLGKQARESFEESFTYLQRAKAVTQAYKRHT